MYSQTQYITRIFEVISCSPSHRCQVISQLVKHFQEHVDLPGVPWRSRSSCGKSTVAAGKSKMEADLAGKIPRWWWFWYSDDGGISWISDEGNNKFHGWLKIRFSQEALSWPLLSQDFIIRNGEVDHHIFFMRSGKAGVYVTTEPPVWESEAVRRVGKGFRLFIWRKRWTLSFFPIISLEGVSTKWLRYVEVCWGWNTRT